MEGSKEGGTFGKGVVLQALGVALRRTWVLFYDHLNKKGWITKRNNGKMAFQDVQGILGKLGLGLAGFLAGNFSRIGESANTR